MVAGDFNAVDEVEVIREFGPLDLVDPGGDYSNPSIAPRSTIGLRPGPGVGDRDCADHARAAASHGINSAITCRCSSNSPCDPQHGQPGSKLCAPRAPSPDGAAPSGCDRRRCIRGRTHRPRSRAAVAPAPGIPRTSSSVYDRYWFSS